MKYITLFETAEAYNAATLDLPNVSLIEENMSVSFNPYVPEIRLVCKYNVTDTSSPTKLISGYEQNIFTSMEIDGVMLNELVTEYTFDTIGVHTVKYELYDETKLGNSAPVFHNNNLVECIIPDSVISIGDNAFTNCRNLASINIPSGITSIGQYAFSQCISLTSCIIGSGVTSIGNYAFISCSNLTSVVIPDSVTSIGNGAFAYCCLTSIISNAMIAPTIGSNTFQDINTGGTLTVPIGSSGYDVWMGTGDYYLGKYNWTKVEQ